jgi:hypothetical protein
MWRAFWWIEHLLLYLWPLLRGAQIEAPNQTRLRLSELAHCYHVMTLMLRGCSEGAQRALRGLSHLLSTQ